MEAIQRITDVVAQATCWLRHINNCQPSTVSRVIRSFLAGILSTPRNRIPFVQIVNRCFYASLEEFKDELRSQLVSPFSLHCVYLSQHVTCGACELSAFVHQETFAIYDAANHPIVGFSPLHELTCCLLSGFDEQITTPLEKYHDFCQQLMTICGMLTPVFGFAQNGFSDQGNVLDAIYLNEYNGESQKLPPPVPFEFTSGHCYYCYPPDGDVIFANIFDRALIIGKQKDILIFFVMTSERFEKSAETLKALNCDYDIICYSTKFISTSRLSSTSTIGNPLTLVLIASRELSPKFRGMHNNSKAYLSIQLSPLAKFNEAAALSFDELYEMELFSRETDVHMTRASRFNAPEDFMPTSQPNNSLHRQNSSSSNDSVDQVFSKESSIHPPQDVRTTRPKAPGRPPHSRSQSKGRKSHLPPQGKTQSVVTSDPPPTLTKIAQQVAALAIAAQPSQTSVLFTQKPSPPSTTVTTDSNSQAMNVRMTVSPHPMSQMSLTLPSYDTNISTNSFTPQPQISQPPTSLHPTPNPPPLMSLTLQNYDTNPSTNLLTSSSQNPQSPTSLYPVPASRTDTQNTPAPTNPQPPPPPPPPTTIPVASGISSSSRSESFLDALSKIARATSCTSVKKRIPAPVAHSASNSSMRSNPIMSSMFAEVMKRHKFIAGYEQEADSKTSVSNESDSSMPKYVSMDFTDSQSTSLTITSSTTTTGPIPHTHSNTTTSIANNVTEKKANVLDLPTRTYTRPETFLCPDIGSPHTASSDGANVPSFLPLSTPKAIPPPPPLAPIPSRASASKATDDSCQLMSASNEAATTTCNITHSIPVLLVIGRLIGMLVPVKSRLPAMKYKLNNSNQVHLAKTQDPMITSYLKTGLPIIILVGYPTSLEKPLPTQPSPLLSTHK